MCRLGLILLRQLHDQIIREQRRVRRPERRVRLWIDPFRAQVVEELVLRVVQMYFQLESNDDGTSWLNQARIRRQCECTVR